MMGRNGRVRSHRTPNAVCDRCSFWYNLDDLTEQFDYRGSKLQNTHFLVCKKCLDVPQEQLRTIILSPDPVPVKNPRPDTQDIAGMSNKRVTTTGDQRVTTLGDDRILEDGE
jgi:hypothetical protein